MICHDVNSKIMTRMARQQNDYAAVFETDLFSQDYDEHLVSAPPCAFPGTTCIDTRFALLAISERSNIACVFRSRKGTRANRSVRATGPHRGLQAIL